VKWQLEDLAFAVLHPKRYAEIERWCCSTRPERESTSTTCSPRSAPARAAPHQAEVTGRPKHYWSIYEKMVVRGKEFDEINDLVGARVTWSP
jgi:GTP pyrophosphokinase